MKFERATSDQCLFIKKSGNPIFIATFVDDLIIASPSSNDIMNFEDDLKQKLNIKILGDVRHILGWNVTSTAEQVKITQEHYIARILEQYGMSDCNDVKTPAAKGQLNATDIDEPDTDFPYRGELVQTRHCSSHPFCGQIRV